MTGKPTQTTSKVSNAPIYQLSSVIKEASMKHTENFVMKRKPSSHATTKLIIFSVSKDEWNIKEGTDKSMKNALYVLWYDKRHLLGLSNIEKIKSNMWP